MQKKDELGENHRYDMVQNFYDEITKDVMSVKQIGGAKMLFKFVGME